LNGRLNLGLVTGRGALQRLKLAAMKYVSPLFGLLLVLGTGPVFAGPPKAVLELFTSQGCSSCPKADKLAAELARDKDLVVLTFPVDYWDYLGWKDTLGAAAHSARQRAYAMVRGDRKVYTPQMVVNGRTQCKGSDRAEIEAAIKHTSSDAALFAVPAVIAEANGQIEVAVPDGAARESEVWLVAVASERTVEIDAGENKSRTISYTNVVRQMTRLGAFTGKAVHFTVPRADAVPADADRYLVMVQDGSGSMPGVILGVAEAPKS
jgi:hypothetical protein